MIYPFYQKKKKNLINVKNLRVISNIKSCTYENVKKSIRSLISSKNS